MGGSRKKIETSSYELEAKGGNGAAPSMALRSLKRGGCPHKANGLRGLRKKKFNRENVR